MFKLNTTRILFSLAVLGCAALIVCTAQQAAAQAKQPQETYILKGSPLGGVKFNHKLHQERVAKKCETCHHPSKPEMAAKAPQQACMDCHVKAVKAPMKTGAQAAFHNLLASAGTCIDCHKKENATGKKAPVGPKCMDCHKKENV